MDDRALGAEIARCFCLAYGDALWGVAVFGSRARADSRPDSDHDILVVADGLAPGPFERGAQVQRPLASLRALGVQIAARTPEEFSRDVTPLHLDLALDAIVLYERADFLSQKLARLRALIAEAGLERGGDLFWRWKRPHVRDWAITWEGVRA